MSVVALVPARAGSKGIPGKNIKTLCGKPLLAYTAEIIKEAGIFDRALLSTDEEEIAGLGRTLGLRLPSCGPRRLPATTRPCCP